MTPISQIILTDEQEEALLTIQGFLSDLEEQAMIIEGYAGCGKSTLIRFLLAELDTIQEANKLITPDYKWMTPVLSATTNKAVNNLHEITKQEVRTIHQVLGLRLKFDPRTRENTLHKASNSEKLDNQIIIIDEASYMDTDLLNLVMKYTQGAKVIFVGDPAQITAVKASYAPVFKMPLTKVSLTQVVRQAKSNPIIDLASKFRDTVNTGEFFSFKPDGKNIMFLNQSDFEDAIIKEFTRSDWKYSDSKVLCWTNKMSSAYNQDIKAELSGSQEMQVGDYMICNKYVFNGKHSIKTDELVYINKISPTTVLDVPGKFVEINGASFFQPDDWKQAQKRSSLAHKAGDWDVVKSIEESWIDLRSAYSCTIDKSQGSTYGKVFIDLNDLKKCYDYNRLARMLYVGVSRARDQVTFTGDLV